MSSSTTDSAIAIAHFSGVSKACKYLVTVWPGCCVMATSHQTIIKTISIIILAVSAVNRISMAMKNTLTTTINARLSALDGWRGICAMLIAIHHFAWMNFTNDH